MGKIILLFVLYSLFSTVNHLSDEKRRKKQFGTNEKKAKKKYVKAQETEEGLINEVQFEESIDYSYELPTEEVLTYDEALLEDKKMPERALRKKATKLIEVPNETVKKTKKGKQLPLKPISLREAYLWKEVLDEPISMRKDA